MHRFLSYLKFLLKSTNQHGVHSPFVYQFVTKGLYQKNINLNILKSLSTLKKVSKKEEKMLVNTINYFYSDVNKSKNINYSKALNKPYKILIINDFKNYNTLNLNDFSSEEIIIFHNTYENNLTLKKWNEIKKHNKVTLSIDLFYFGIIFNRKQQAKEHFYLRA